MGYMLPLVRFLRIATPSLVWVCALIKAKVEYNGVVGHGFVEVFFGLAPHPTHRNSSNGRAGMHAKRVLALCALVGIFGLATGTFVELVDAQKDTKQVQGLDKGLATKKGISDSLTTKTKSEEEESTRPTRLQMGVGVGSFVVAYIVVKWL